MSRRRRHPTDPDVVAAIIQDMRAMTRDQWIAELSKYPDWDPAWLNPVPAAEEPTASNGTKPHVRRAVRTRRKLATDVSP